MNHFGQNQYYNPQDGLIHGHRNINIHGAPTGVVYQPMYSSNVPSAPAPAVQQVDGNHSHGAVQLQPGYTAIPAGASGQWYTHNVIPAQTVMAWPPAQGAPASGGVFAAGSPNQPVAPQGHALYAHPVHAAPGQSSHAQPQAVYSVPSGSPAYILESRPNASAAAPSSSNASKVYAESEESPPVRRDRTWSMSSDTQSSHKGKSRNRSPDQSASKRSCHDASDSRSAGMASPDEHGARMSSGSSHGARQGSSLSAFRPPRRPEHGEYCRDSTVRSSDNTSNHQPPLEPIEECPPLLSSLKSPMKSSSSGEALHPSGSSLVSRKQQKNYAAHQVQSSSPVVDVEGHDLSDADGVSEEEEASSNAMSSSEQSSSSSHNDPRGAYGLAFAHPVPVSSKPPRLQPIAKPAQSSRLQAQLKKNKPQVQPKPKQQLQLKQKQQVQPKQKQQVPAIPKLQAAAGRPRLSRTAAATAAVAVAAGSVSSSSEEDSSGDSDSDDDDDDDDNSDSSSSSSSSGSDSDSSSSTSDSSSSSDGSDSSSSGEEDETREVHAAGGAATSESSSSSESELEPEPARPESAFKPVVSPATQRVGRRRQVDEAAVKVPLKYGWKRDTRLRPKFRGAMRGDVFYFSPCGKKLRTYPEVQRYLDDKAIKNLNISNFSFSTKLMVGDFHEKIQGKRELVKLSSKEVMERQLIADRRWKPKGRLGAASAPTPAAASVSSRAQSTSSRAQSTSSRVRGSKAAAAAAPPPKKYGRRRGPEPKVRGKKLTAFRKKQAKAERARIKEEAKRRKIEEKVLKKELKMQEKALRIQQAEEMKQQRRMEAERLRLEDLRRRQVEREVKRDELKKEREMRRLQLLKEKEEKRQHAVLRRQEEARFKAEEREKKRVELMMRREEEAKKRAEEKEKVREQKLAERRQKMAEKRHQEELERCRRRPGEDLLVGGGSELPKLPKLVTPFQSKEFGMLLTIYQFLQDFSGVLDLEFADGYIPELADLVKYVMSSDYVDDFLRLCEQMLTVILADENCGAQQVDDILGKPLSTIKLNHNHLSEVLRLYIANGLSQPSGKCMVAVQEVIPLLDRFPISALSPVWKMRVLNFLVNEISSSSFLAQHVEKQLELAADLKRDKMKVECRLRKLRILYKKIFARQRRPRRTADLSQFPPTAIELFNSGQASASSAAGASPGKSDAGTERNSTTGRPFEDEEYDDEEDVSDDDDDGSGTEADEQGDEADSDEDNESIDIQQFEGEPSVQTKESAEEQIAFCVKWQNRLRNRYNTAMRQVRYGPTGHDRYFRRYWTFPGQSDVYVEGLDCDPLSSTIRTIANDPTQAAPRPYGLDSTSTTPVSHAAQAAARPTKRASFVEMERQRLLETQALWAARDAEEEDRQEQLRSHSMSSAAASNNGPPNHHLHASEPGSMYTPTTANPNSAVAAPVGMAPALLTQPSLSGDGPGVPVTPTDCRASDCSVAGGESPVKSIATVGSADEVPEHLQETVDVLSLTPDIIDGWFHLKSTKEMTELCDALHPRGQREQLLHHSLHRHIEGVGDQPEQQTEGMEDTSVSADSSSSPLNDASIVVEHCKDILQDMVKMLQDMAQRVVDANLQAAGGEIEKDKVDGLSSIEDDDDLLTEARDQLLSLESVIDRRYLKPPFREKKTASSSKNKEAREDGDDVPAALASWRSSVSSASSASQLQLYAWQLTTCLAWEKSIMKVFCQGCRKGDNEDLLLLCDECENGYHTYCCTPKLSAVPEDDWFCWACILMAERGAECESCSGKGSGHVLCCEQCNKIYHLACLSPSLTKMPRQPWSCTGCRKQTKQRRQNEEENRQGKRKDMSVCRSMMTELEKHEDGWPFLSPVSRKQFPDYYKVIDTPMDFSTIRQRLKDGKMTSREEFASNVRLVFENCCTFNEDDSEVGCAGHTMRKFFDKRWKEVCSASSSSSGS